MNNLSSLSYKEPVTANFLAAISMLFCNDKVSNGNNLVIKKIPGSAAQLASGNYL